jgi:hypothetical protein
MNNILKRESYSTLINQRYSLLMKSRFVSNKTGTSKSYGNNKHSLLY